MFFSHLLIKGGKRFQRRNQTLINKVESANLEFEDFECTNITLAHI